MPHWNQGSLTFLDFTVDVAAERLYSGKSEVPLRPKSFQVLRYLVERSGRLVTREELLQAVWKDVAVTDESVTKCIVDIRKAIADDAQQIIRTIPRRGFVFEPEAHATDLSQDATADGGAGPVPSPVRTRFAVAGASLVLAGALVAVGWWAWPGSGPHYEAIAVLPFESLGDDPDQQYMADGLTDALITDLGQSSPIRVIARASVTQYSKSRKAVQQIARELKVDVLVEGTIARSGNRLRVTANLIQVSPERHIWAHSYEQELRDTLMLQNEIGRAIAMEIRGNLVPREKARFPVSRPLNPEAQLAYWKAQYLLKNTRGLEDIHKIVEYSEQAVRMDSGYAPYYASLSRGYALLADSGEKAPKEVMPRARAAAEHAIALDDGLASAHTALCSVLLIYDRDWGGAERETRRAIELNHSDANAHFWLANYLAAVGHVDEAVAEARFARELDPLSFAMNWHVGRMLCLARKYDDALAELKQAEDMQPNTSPVGIWMSKSYWMKKQYREAIAKDLAVRRRRDGLDAGSVNALERAYEMNGAAGYWTKLRALLLSAYSTNAIGWYRLAEIDTYLGNRTGALAWLEKAADERPNWIPFIKVDPTLDTLRSDHRFTALLRRMALE